MSWQRHPAALILNRAETAPLQVKTAKLCANRLSDRIRISEVRHSSLIDIAAIGGNLDKKIANTLQAMRDGFEIIFQATLRYGSLMGHADFLRKVSRPSELGNWSYEVMDTKLARSTKAKFIVAASANM